MRMNALLARVSGITIALALAVTASAQESAPTGAQEAEDQADAVLEEVVVTGSNIRGAPPVGSMALNIAPEDEVAAGVSNVMDLMRKVPQVVGFGFSETNREPGSGGAPNTSYLSAINLRGIGPDATLTLMDGQRIVPMGTGAFAIDPSAIPMNMIQRIDVVADGASAIYGSDAVAGVANIILRREFDGVEVRGKYGFADDYDERQASVTAGRGWETGQITLGYEYAFHSNLSGLDRDFFTDNQPALGGFNNLPITCNPGTLAFSNGPGAPPTYYAVPQDGILSPDQVNSWTSGPNRCDLLKTQDLLPEVERNSVAATFDQDLSDNIHLFGSGFYWNRKATYLNPVQSFNATLRPNTTPSSWALIPPAEQNRQSGTVSYALTQIPRNLTDGQSKSYNVVFGARIGLPRDFELELNGSYGHTHDSTFSDRGTNAGLINAAIASGAFNPFDPNASIDRDWYSGTFDVDSFRDQQSYIAKIDGHLFALPGGDVAVAVGGQHQKIEFEGFEWTFAPPSLGAYTQLRKANSKKIDSLFAEFLIPIVGPENAKPGIRSLTFNAAARYDKYTGDVETDTTNPKFGLTYEPFEGLSLRASYGTSFRAPNSQELFGVTTGLYILPYFDVDGSPLKSVAQVGANLNVKPEQATTYSFGVDFEPASIPGLLLRANYFNIDYTDRLGGVTIDMNYADGLEAIGAIVRNPSVEFLENLQCPVPGTDRIACGPPRVAAGPYTPDFYNVDLWVDWRPRNSSATKMDGIDFSASYVFDAFGGEMSLNLNSVYNLTYENQGASFLPSVDELNNLFEPKKFQARANAMYKWDALEAGLFVSYVNGYTNTVNNTDIGSWTSFDAHLGYVFTGDGGSGLLNDWSIALDVSNLFDTDPPYAQLRISPPPGSGGGGFDGSVASAVGRIIAVSASVRF